MVSLVLMVPLDPSDLLEPLELKDVLDRKASLDLLGPMERECVSYVYMYGNRDAFYMYKYNVHSEIEGGNVILSIK